MVYCCPISNKINFSFSSAHTSSVAQSTPDKSSMGTRGLASTERVESDIEVIERETDKTSGIKLVCVRLLHFWYASR